MSEITIALDAGHGGSDSGAVYKSRKEKDDTLRLTRAVGQILENSGINVYYVREDDEYETPFKKATDANNAGADCRSYPFISRWPIGCSPVCLLVAGSYCTESSCRVLSS